MGNVYGKLILGKEMKKVVESEDFELAEKLRRAIEKLK